MQSPNLAQFERFSVSRGTPDWLAPWERAHLENIANADENSENNNEVESNAEATPQTESNILQPSTLADFERLSNTVARGSPDWLAPWERAHLQNLQEEDYDGDDEFLENDIVLAPNEPYIPTIQSPITPEVEITLNRPSQGGEAEQNTATPAVPAVRKNVRTFDFTTYREQIVTNDMSMVPVAQELQVPPVIPYAIVVEESFDVVSEDDDDDEEASLPEQLPQIPRTTRDGRWLPPWERARLALEARNRQIGTIDRTSNSIPVQSRAQASELVSESLRAAQNLLDL